MNFRTYKKFKNNVNKLYVIKYNIERDYIIRKRRIIKNVYCNY